MPTRWQSGTMHSICKIKKQRSFFWKLCRRRRWTGPTILSEMKIFWNRKPGFWIWILICIESTFLESLDPYPDLHILSHGIRIWICIWIRIWSSFFTFLREKNQAMDPEPDPQNAKNVNPESGSGSANISNPGSASAWNGCGSETLQKTLVMVHTAPVESKDWLHKIHRILCETNEFTPLMKSEIKIVWKRKKYSWQCF